MADRAVKGTVFRAADTHTHTKKNQTVAQTAAEMLSCDIASTRNDVLDGAVFPLVNMAAVFSLSPSELCDQFLLLTFPPVRRRLQRERDEKGVFTGACQGFRDNPEPNVLIQSISGTLLDVFT